MKQNLPDLSCHLGPDIFLMKMTYKTKALSVLIYNLIASQNYHQFLFIATAKNTVYIRFDQNYPDVPTLTRTCAYIACIKYKFIIGEKQQVKFSNGRIWDQRIDSITDFKYRVTINFSILISCEMPTELTQTSTWTRFIIFFVWSGRLRAHFAVQANILYRIVYEDLSHPMRFSLYCFIFLNFPQR